MFTSRLRRDSRQPFPALAGTPLQHATGSLEQNGSADRRFQRGNHRRSDRMTPAGCHCGRSTPLPGRPLRLLGRAGLTEELLDSVHHLCQGGFELLFVMILG